MTKAQAALLQTQWKQQGDPPPACQHSLQELASSELNEQGHVLNTYHCRECGEFIVHRLKGNSVPDSRLLEAEYFNEP
jgi:hypothetical protein